MVLPIIQDASTWLTHFGVISSAIADVARSLPIDGSVDHLFLAQQIPQTDLVGDLQRAFDNFVKTGQAWAFVVGIILGYMLKAFTSFG